MHGAASITPAASSARVFCIMRSPPGCTYNHSRLPRARSACRPRIPERLDVGSRQAEEKAMAIDMHSHWRPPALIDALRARDREPRIVRNAQGVEVLKTRMGEEPVDAAFDSVEKRLADMDRS